MTRALIRFHLAPRSLKKIGRGLQENSIRRQHAEPRAAGAEARKKGHAPRRVRKSKSLAARPPLYILLPHA